MSHRKKSETLILGCKNSVIPSTVKTIGERAFYCCIELTEIVIPSTVEKVEYDAFSVCAGLKRMVVTNSNISLGGSVLGECKNLTVEFVEGITELPDGILSNAFDIASIIIPSTVTAIGNEALLGCSSLKSIVVKDGNSVYSSEGNCLIEKTSKTLILGCSNSVIPNGIVKIRDYAFLRCKEFSDKIEIPATVQEIGKNAFYECEDLTIKFGEGTKKIPDGALSYAKGVASVIIPSGVTQIGERAFAECSKITEIELPSSVTEIKKRVFENCSELAEITIPGNVKEIGEGAFEGCENLKEIVIPAKVTKIENSTFFGCTKLEEVQFLSSELSIGSFAFEDCSSLKKMIYPGTIEQWNRLEKGEGWDFRAENYTIYCTDGTISKQ